jgi:hypothetical protein
MRRTFLGHWIISLVCAAMFAFAYAYGIPQLIWASDQSYMTSAIAALVVGAAIWLGWQAWLADSGFANSDFGQEAQLLAPALGMLGTVIGLSMQAKALVAGAAGLGALSTSLFTTGAGIAGFIIIKVMTLNLEVGIRRAGR